MRRESSDKRTRGMEVAADEEEEVEEEAESEVLILS
jgi:hypothetical protein